MDSMNRSTIYRIMLCVIMTGAVWIVAPGMAESSSGEGKALSQEEEIQAFAKANVKVAKVQTALAEKSGKKVIDLNAPIDDLPNENKIPTIQAIEAQGLTVEEYNSLLETYRSNEAFRSKVVEAILNLHPDPVEPGK